MALNLINPHVFLCLWHILIHVAGESGGIRIRQRVFCRLWSAIWM